jgi:hypothetical protein
MPIGGCIPLRIVNKAQSSLSRRAFVLLSVDTKATKKQAESVKHTKNFNRVFYEICGVWSDVIFVRSDIIEAGEMCFVE